MSTLRVDAIQNRTGGDLVNSKGMARAWVNFNGSGTVAIRAAHNVSSITDNGTGAYTVNFTSAMADANYVLAAFASYGASTAAAGLVTAGNDFAPAAGSCLVKTSNSGNAALQDANFVSVAFFD